MGSLGCSGFNSESRHIFSFGHFLSFLSAFRLHVYDHVRLIDISEENELIYSHLPLASPRPAASRCLLPALEFGRIG